MYLAMGFQFCLWRPLTSYYGDNLAVVKYHTQLILAVYTQILPGNVAMLAGSLADPIKQQFSDYSAMLAGSLAVPTKHK